MMQIVEQTKEEKIAMYMKLSKKELAIMLCEANRIIEKMPVQVYISPPLPDDVPGIQPNPIWLVDPNSGPFYTTSTN